MCMYVCMYIYIYLFVVLLHHIQQWPNLSTDGSSEV